MGTLKTDVRLNPNYRPEPEPKPNISNGVTRSPMLDTVILVFLEFWLLCGLVLAVAVYHWFLIEPVVTWFTPLSVDQEVNDFQTHYGFVLHKGLMLDTEHEDGLLRLYGCKPIEISDPEGNVYKSTADKYGGDGPLGCHADEYLEIKGPMKGLWHVRKGAMTTTGNLIAQDQWVETHNDLEFDGESTFKFSYGIKNVGGTMSFYSNPSRDEMKWLSGRIGLVFAGFTLIIIVCVALFYRVHKALVNEMKLAWKEWREMKAAEAA